MNKEIRKAKKKEKLTGLSVTGEAVWKTPWQPWITDLTESRSRRSTLCRVSLSEAPSSSFKCPFLGSSEKWNPKFMHAPPKVTISHNLRYKSKLKLCMYVLVCKFNVVKWHAWVSEGSSDSVAFLQEKLDHPRSDEATGAGDTDGLGRRWRGIRRRHCG